MGALGKEAAGFSSFSRAESCHPDDRESMIFGLCYSATGLSAALKSWLWSHVQHR